MSITWIEASAGTGKTYTLVNTVLKMVVEQGLPVDQILMVTFTDKATAELKTRIRKGLRDAWKTTKEPRLAQALEDLASLSITTIHGFCRTLLTQFPLESGISFEPEMVDQARQWRRLLREELRPRLTSLDANLLAWAGVESEESLLELASDALNRNLFALPLLHPDPAEQRLFETIRHDLEQGAGPLWQALDAGFSLPEDSLVGLGAEAIGQHLHASWHRNPYRVVRELMEARTFHDLAPLLTADNLEYLEKWTRPYEPRKGIWKKDSGERPALLEGIVTVATDVMAVLASWTSALPAGVGPAAFLAGAARYTLLEGLCRPVLARRSTRELTFHDLIDRVRALVTQGETSLSQRAAARWKAVLIDEFQDTDPEQWEIFRTLFSGEDHQLVLVGDPKQSIYRFRGADLDVYRAVRDEVKAAGARTLVLEENFRSTSAMIGAVNRLFDPSVAPWDHPDDFQPSQKGQKPIAELVRRHGEHSVALPPLAEYQDTDERTWHRHLVETLVGFLDGNHALDDGTVSLPVTPGDFLILVRKKKEAWALYRQLTARGIPATVGGSGGLLKGREAREVLLFLKALESPRSLPAARALTWTRLFAGADLDRLMPALAEASSDRDRGAFLRAFRRVAAALEPGVIDGGGLEALLALPEGKRIVTNAEHVLELVQERHHRGEVPPGQVALSLETWITSRLQEDEVDLRRDRETNTVRLMTVHAAKGLEAPIVLHGKPSGGAPQEAPWIIAGGVDFLKSQTSREAEERNLRAEELRLQYVALTRARTHQVFVNPASQALPVPEAPRGTQGPTFTANEGPVVVPDLHPGVEGLEFRHPWVESHSGLWRRATRDEAVEKTVWDRPQVRREDEGPGEAKGVVDLLPAGPVFGDLVHDILEEVDFRAWAPGASADLKVQAEALVAEHCQRNRAAFQGRDLSRLLQPWIARALNHPFALGDDPLVLSTLAPQDSRRELEFHLPLAPGAPSSCIWGERIFPVHPGYLTGRIDLLFQRGGKLYLADWKTNRLAPGQEVDELMSEAGYDLQAQWYWEALNRLCPLQNETLVPGGVLYVFLRGASDGPAGVFLSPSDLEGRTALKPFLREVSRG